MLGFVSLLLFVHRWTKNHKKVSSNVVVLKERVIKLAALTRGQWHHLVISCRQVKPSTETKSEENLQSSEVCIVDVPGAYPLIPLALLFLCPPFLNLPMMALTRTIRYWRK